MISLAKPAFYLTQHDIDPTRNKYVTKKNVKNDTRGIDWADDTVFGLIQRDSIIVQEK